MQRPQLFPSSLTPAIWPALGITIESGLADSLY